MSDTHFAKNEAVRLGLLLVLIGLLSVFILLSHNSLHTSRAAGFEPSGLPGLLAGAESDPALKLRVAEAYGKVPLGFEANEGQTDQQVKFLTRGPGYNLFLTSSEAVLSLRHTNDRIDTRRRLQNDVVRMKLVRANSAPKIEAAEMLPGKSNYFIGNDSTKWHVNVPTFARVNYREVYPGVDVVYYGNQQELENDFVVAPGVDPGVIRLAFNGASRISIEHDGSLCLRVGLSEVRLLKPAIYQVVDGARREVVGNYVMKNRKQVGFEVGSYDPAQPLVIDPILIYSTYLGGTGQDTGYGIALDQFGSAYVTGEAGSATFPTLNSNQASGGGQDAFVTKFNAAGSALVYSTFLGGNTGFEHGYDIAVDLAGNAYVVGTTIATDFPTTASGLQPTKLTGSSQDTSFVTRLNATGAIFYSTYLSGTQGSRGFGIATDGVGNAYVTGAAGSGFPVTASAFSSTTFNTGFLTRLNTNASGAGSLAYSTFLGPTGFAEGKGIAVDGLGNAYITGETNSTSTNFTSPGAFQTTFGGGTFDAFIAKFDTKLSGAASRIYSTYLGGSNQDFGGNAVARGSKAIAIDVAGNAYVTGQTQSTNFPLANAFQAANAGGVDAFLTKLNATGSALIYSTYLGGSSASNADEGSAVAVNIAGNAYVTGRAQSTDFPISSPIEIPGATTGGVFVTKFTPAGNALVYSTRLGRPNVSSDEAGQGIALDAAGNAFVTGFARVEFPTKGAFQPNPGGITDAFVSQIADPTVIGRVLDENANPIAGAAVNLTGVPSATTTTDSNGCFTFGMLVVGNNYTVSVNAGNYTFSAQAADNIQRNVRRDFGPLTFNISGQVALPGKGGLAGVTMTLSDGKLFTTQTDVGGNYVFLNLPAGRNYTVTPTHNSYSFAPTSRSFGQLNANSIGNFVGTQVLANITGKVTDNKNIGISNVNLTLSGPITRVGQSDTNGNYSFLNLTVGGNYALTAQSPYLVFVPPRADFPNLGSNQISNFVSDPIAVPGPTPSLSDNFDGPNRDPNKWNLGTLTQPPAATDPLVTTAQVSGQLVITPLKSASGLHYNGYVSTNSFDIRNASATVEVVKAASAGADTIFAIGSDANNFTRFMVHTAAGSTVLAPDSKATVFESATDPTVSQLIFQVNLGGTITSLSIPYDPVLHRFMRFRHEAATNSIVFETSPDNIVFTERHRVVLQKGVSAQTAELSAGTSTPTTPGTAVFDNFSLVTSTFQFSGGTYAVGEADSSVLVTVTRTSSSDAASIGYETSDGTATQTSKYISAAGTLSFAPGQTSRTFSVSIVDNALAEGNQTVNLMLASPVGSGLSSPGRAVLTIVDNDVVLTAAQINQLKAWTVGGRTYIYVKPQFPDAGYRVANWGLPVRSVNDFTVDASVERLPGPSIQAVVTTAQIYDLGPLANGTYNFDFKTSGTLAKTLAFTVSSTVPPANVIDTAREFVKQQYRDFLNREADQAGEDFWTDNITKCSDPARRPAGQTVEQCTLRQRETTSGAFFLSPEFQYTGYYVYRMYQGGLGRQPKLSEFIPDAQFVGNGIVVSGQLSGTVINQNKANFAAQFVNCTDATKYRCSEFKAIYDGLNNQQYVDRLFLTTGVNASASDRAALVNGLNATPATETRATVLQKVVDGVTVLSEGNQQFTTTYGQAFYNLEFNRAFVELEYFGYMKRDPDDAGYAFWLAKLNSFNGSFVNAEMVLAFISSPEYRARFGQP
jgi:hypothetical protein